jgi:membrane protein YdbS with pleckstrin-like domain
MFSTLSDTFWILILAVIVLFAFFVALGALHPGEVAGLTVAILALTALWIAHARWDAKRHVGRDVATVRARERRGF